MIFVQKINGYCLQSVEFIYVSKFIRLHSLEYLGNVNCLSKEREREREREREGWYLFTVESELLGGGGEVWGVDVSKSNSTT